MTIQSSDLVFLKAKVNTNTGFNGGGMSHVLSASGVSGNIFPTIGDAERRAGSITYRKIFLKNEAVSDTLYNAVVYIEKATSSADYVVMFAGSLTNTQSDLTGSERLYGCAKLNANLTAGATSLTAQVEASGLVIFAVGDSIRVSNKTSIDDLNGTEEYVTITSVSLAGDVATIQFTPAVENSYVAASSKVSSILSLGDLGATFSSFTLSSTGGSFDISNHPLVLDARGVEYQTYTFTFTTSNSFTITGNTLGNLGTGTLAGGASPLNPSTNQPLFTIPAAGFSGVFAPGDSFSFSTTPAAAAIWYKRVVPANTPSATGVTFVTVIDGESE